MFNDFVVSVFSIHFFVPYRGTKKHSNWLASRYKTWFLGFTRSDVCDKFII